uniref:Uncharacterized protein n=1 Tax=Macaca fascicularis TaxID=9541 RepID=A0A7N9CT12_MACFA
MAPFCLCFSKWSRREWCFIVSCALCGVLIMEGPCRPW